LEKPKCLNGFAGKPKETGPWKYGWAAKLTSAEPLFRTKYLLFSSSRVSHYLPETNTFL
jgi:hypothetical protein